MKMLKIQRMKIIFFFDQIENLTKSHSSNCLSNVTIGQIIFPFMYKKKKNDIF